MNNKPDLSQVHNPYDFGNPVTNRNLFSGREKELSEIKYYLDQAIRAPRPTNLALLGSRAAGKTSLLNMIELEAKERGMCTARINLNEGDASEEVSFFYKIFDCVFSAVCEFRLENLLDERISFPFGGKGGKTYQAYLDMISAYEIPSDKQWCPFIFPIQYAKSMNAGVRGVKVSDQNFMNDLRVIHEEVKNPIALLFDECNVLANQRILLEMLRNVFMNIPGYMLVFTGTEDLFPVMDEVFSPIIRQFKKIEVGSFETTSETKECISKPLESIGIHELEEIMDRRTISELSQIHNLTGGRPYEIQLLCHFMFRRVQMGNATKMKLDLDILDDVLIELKRAQDIDARPIIGHIRNLEDRKIFALSLLLACNKHATLDQMWFVEFTFRGTSKWNKDELAEAQKEFEAAGIIKSKAGIMQFAGDDFDRIYVKYYAQRRRLGLAFPNRRPEEYFNSRLAMFCLRNAGLIGLNELHIVDIVHNLGLRGKNSWPTTSSDSVDIIELHEAIKSHLGAHDNCPKLPEQLVEQLYWLIFENELRKVGDRAIVNIRVTFPWTIQNYPFYLPTEQTTASLSDFTERLGGLANRASQLGGTVSMSLSEVRAISIKDFARLLNHCVGKPIIGSIVENHLAGMAVSYMAEDKQIDAAKLHAELVRIFDTDISASNLNNLGYLELALGNMTAARETFNASIKKGGHTNPVSALPYYNLGVLEAMSGNNNDALADFRTCVKLCGERYIAEFKSVTIFVPFEATNNAIEFSEQSFRDLYDSARTAVIMFEEVGEVDKGDTQDLVN